MSCILVPLMRASRLCSEKVCFWSSSQVLLESSREICSPRKWLRKWSIFGLIRRVAAACTKTSFLSCAKRAFSQKSFAHFFLFFNVDLMYLKHFFVLHLNMYLHKAKISIILAMKTSSHMRAEDVCFSYMGRFVPSKFAFEYVVPDV